MEVSIDFTILLYSWTNNTKLFYGAFFLLFFGAKAEENFFLVLPLSGPRRNLIGLTCSAIQSHFLRKFSFFLFSKNNSNSKFYLESSLVGREHRGYSG